MTDSYSENEELQSEAQKQLEALALSITNPEALARAFGHWLRTKMPDRVAESMWVDMEGNRDKGLSVRIYEAKLPRWPKFKARLSGLLGLKSYGADLSMVVHTTKQGAHVAIGVGAVAPFSNYRDFHPVATLSVRF